MGWWSSIICLAWTTTHKRNNNVKVKLCQVIFFSFFLQNIALENRMPSTLAKQYIDWLPSCSSVVEKTWHFSTSLSHRFINRKVCHWKKPLRNSMGDSSHSQIFHRRMFYSTVNLCCHTWKLTGVSRFPGKSPLGGLCPLNLTPANMRVQLHAHTMLHWQKRTRQK